MNFREMNWENRIRLICTLLMLGWAAYVFYSMYESYYVLYPYSPESIHNYTYNVESSFRVYGVMFLIETIVLAAIWRPWSFRLNKLGAVSHRASFVRHLELSCDIFYFL
ncbi:MAG: hypothetical protein ACR2GD_00480 [Pyrinomonadaceae bacterium]